MNVNVPVSGLSGSLADIVAGVRAGATTLDLRSLDEGNTQHRRLGWVTWHILANALLGVAETRTDPLDVLLPSSKGMLQQLARCGVLFAVARHPLLCPVTDDASVLEPWLRDWGTEVRAAHLTGSAAVNAHDVEQMNMFDDDHTDEAGSPARVAERTYAFVNAHREGSGHFKSYQPGAALPWLWHVVPLPAEEAPRREPFLMDVERAVVEVLDNPATHAFRRDGALKNRTDWLRYAGDQIDRSCVLVTVTKGGGEESFNRLWFSAFDNGFGIGRTLRWQHGNVKEPTGELLQRLLSRRLSERGIDGHSGIGLWWIRDLLSVYGGELVVLTENDEDPTGSTTVMAHTEGRDEIQVETIDGIPYRGTAVTVMLRVPKAGEVAATRGVSAPVRNQAPLAHAGS